MKVKNSSLLKLKKGGIIKMVYTSSIILECLQNHVGKENAITAKQMGIRGAQVRAAVHYLRKKGYPICSSSNGYWIAKDVKEIKQVQNSLYQRAEAILDAVGGLDKSILNRYTTSFIEEQ